MAGFMDAPATKPLLEQTDTSTMIMRSKLPLKLMHELRVYSLAYAFNFPASKTCNQRISSGPKRAT